jgi:SAM-dependent methyltransferase
VNDSSALDAATRASLSEGRSDAAIHGLVDLALTRAGVRGGTCVDVGCGAGDLGRFLGSRFARYVGADVLRYPDFPSELDFVEVDLDRGRVALDDEIADVVVCVETVEHVENPRALVRELKRLARPGGLVVITTPNQLSLHSKLGLVVRNEFPHFQEARGLYPAHITALLEVDLVRIVAEVGLVDHRVLYSASGRIPFTPRQWPAFLSAHVGRRARAFSDNVLIAARKPGPHA